MTDVAQIFISKIYDLKHLLCSDLYAMDARWTLFIAAASSYRYDMLLKPFYPKYNNTKEQGINIELLLAVINDTPALNEVRDMIIDENYNELDSEVVDLLHWVLVSKKDPTLRSLKGEEFKAVLSKIPKKVLTTNPTHIFEVIDVAPNSKDDRFKCYDGFQIKQAFHGSKLDSFHSIIKHGLHQHMCQNGFFGEGIYLSSEVSVSLNYSPNSTVWKKSLCGSLISCVAICEYIEDPNYVKYINEEDRNKNVPESYIVITNNDILKLRYLLFYSSHNKQSSRNIIMGWLNKNKHFLIIFCYALFLTVIGVVNNGYGVYLKHIVSKKLFEILKLFQKWFGN